MTIKVWDYVEEYKIEREEILAAVDRVFQSGVLVLGNSVKSFESEFATYCGVRYGVGVDNATNGICLALKALGIGQGDEVITVSNTAVPTVSAIVQAGAIPRFVDIESDTGLLDVSKLEAAITSRTRCVIPVHLYGQSVDMRSLLKITSLHKLRVVEDCAQAHGASHFGKRVGSMGDMGVFSFYPTKLLGGYGDGGLITTDSEELDAQLRRLRFYGMKGTYNAEEFGYNSRLDEVQAEILRVKLPRLDGYISRRRALAERYRMILNGTSLRMPVERDGNFQAYYVFVVRHPDRDRIIAELKANDIMVNISYPWPIHTMNAFSNLGGAVGDLPVTEAAAKLIFSLPMYPTLTEQQQDTVCLALGNILGETVGI